MHLIDREINQRTIPLRYYRRHGSRLEHDIQAMKSNIRPSFKSSEARKLRSELHINLACSKKH